jgi:hypothetical protein
MNETKENNANKGPAFSISNPAAGYYHSRAMSCQAAAVHGQLKRIKQDNASGLRDEGQ